MSQYQIPVSSWKATKVENLKLVNEQGESYLKYLSEVSQRITARAYSIITVLVSINTALMIYLVSESAKTEIRNDFLFFFSLGVIVAIIVLIVITSRLIMPRSYMPVGRAPKEVCNDGMLGVNEADDELSLKAYLMNEIENCQVKIDFNESQNGQRNLLISKIVKWIIGLLIIFSSAVFLGILCS
jgi:hypothetical protein